MNLKKAIEIIQLRLSLGAFRHDPDALAAFKLLIEAGKAIQDEREGNPLLDGELLPSETDD